MFAKKNIMIDVEIILKLMDPKCNQLVFSIKNILNKIIQNVISILFNLRENVVFYIFINVFTFQ